MRAADQLNVQKSLMTENAIQAETNLRKAMKQPYVIV